MRTRKQATTAVETMRMRHMDDALRIESECFPYPWDLDAFITHLSRINTIGFVVKFRGLMAGYAVAEYRLHFTNIVNIAVVPEFRMQGVGTMLVDEIKARKPAANVIAEACEANLPGQLFFRRNRFRCIETLEQVYDNSDQSAYVFFHDPRKDAVQ